MIPRGTKTGPRLRVRLMALGALALLLLLSRPALADTQVCCVCAPKNNLAAKSCITGTGTTCAELQQNTKNTTLKAAQCDPALLKPSECKPSSQSGGLCPIGPLSDDAFSAALSADSASSTLTGPIIPQLMVPIPGLSFSTNLEEKNGRIAIPFIAQYLAAAYRYLTGISALAAAIMLSYGGFLYIFNAARGQAQKGKQIMVNAIIGLVIILGAYTILNTLNPQLLTFKSLDIPVIKPQIFSIPDNSFQRVQALAASNSGYKPDPEIQQALKASSGGKTNQPRLFPETGFDPRTTISQEDLFTILNVVATKAGVDACIPKAIVGTEAGFTNNAISHDENILSIDSKSRLDFLRSGLKFSKTPFDKPALPADCGGSNSSTCAAIVQASGSIQNDDGFSASPPDFGLDWRFAHRFGAAQATIPASPNCYGPNKERGLLIGGTCFTIPVLFTWEGQLDYLAKALKVAAGAAQTPCGIFNAYSGTTDPNCTGPAMSAKMKSYNACKAK